MNAEHQQVSRTLMPFGKYRGQSLTVVRRDRQYCGWLCAQDWFLEKFGYIARRLAPEPITGATVVPWTEIQRRFDRQTAQPKRQRRTKERNDTTDRQEAPCAV